MNERPLPLKPKKPYVPASCGCKTSEDKIIFECPTMKRLRKETYEAMREQFNSESHQRLADQLYEHAKHALETERILSDVQNSECMPANEKKR